MSSIAGRAFFSPIAILWKLLHKDEIVSISVVFRFTPYIVFVAPIFCHPAPVQEFPDRTILSFSPLVVWLTGGASLLALGGFFATLAAIDTANPYGPIGASRTRMVGCLAEPLS